MNAMTRQQGFSFTGFIVVAVIVVVVAIFSMKLIPSYMQNSKIQKAFQDIARDPNMQNAPDKDILTSFINRAVIMDSVSIIRPEDVVISHENGNLVLSADYSVKVPLAGNVSLLMEFHPTTAK